jgi:hypothetical protein
MPPLRVPAWLFRLMQYNGLSPSLCASLKPEERLSVTFANELRAMTLTGDLRAVWFHPANELVGRTSSGARAALARAMGLIPGAGDFILLGDTRNLALEAKIGKGNLSPSQEDFRLWCEATNVPYRVFRTVEEGVAAVREAGLLR